MPSSAFHPRKRLGQNFLIDNNIVRKIIGAACLSRDDVVLEIGPGKGVLTYELAQLAKTVIAIEIDKILYNDLKENLRSLPNVHIIHADILECDLKALQQRFKITQKFKVIGNIPYSITTPIIEYVFEQSALIETVYMMVQREFAQRIVAQPHSKTYASLSCFVQFYTYPELLFPVRKTCFRPVPKVDSYVIQLTPRPLNSWPGDVRPRNQEQFLGIVRTAFNQRRKTILNSLSPVADRQKLLQAFSALHLNPRLRAEDLTLEDYMRIANLFI